MTRIFLAAGAAALAVAVPAIAGPGGNGGHDREAGARRGGGGPGAEAPRPRGGNATRMQRAERERAVVVPRAERAPRSTMVERPQRAERTQMRAERPRVRANRDERAQARTADRHQPRANRMRQAQNRREMTPNRTQQAQNRAAGRQQLRANRGAQAQNRATQRRQLQATSQGQAQSRMAGRQQLQAQATGRQQLQANRQTALQNRVAVRQQLQAARQMRVQDRVAAIQNLRADRFTTLSVAPRTRLLDPLAATALVGVPLLTATTVTALRPLPQTVAYLYPPTPNFYYQYGDGYVYRIDRDTNLIAALIPLLAGGYFPGSYLPAPYMRSYVPAYYGYSAFYPDYGNTCYRYGYGVVYEVDCFTGLVVDVIPTYAGGYGVGQLLPVDYSYYNIPYQYRRLYYDSGDYRYWYAPGAIYRYDPRSSMIMSVAALLSPGFTIGQPLPMGYGVYNVPIAYRATYFDSPTAWYRYSNGYIYRVDPTTLLVSAIVASALA